MNKQHSPVHELIAFLARDIAIAATLVLSPHAAPPHHETLLSNTTNHLPALIGLEHRIRKEKATNRHYK